MKSAAGTMAFDPALVMLTRSSHSADGDSECDTSMLTYGGQEIQVIQTISHSKLRGSDEFHKAVLSSDHLTLTVTRVWLTGSGAHGMYRRMPHPTVQHDIVQLAKDKGLVQTRRQSSACRMRREKAVQLLACLAVLLGVIVWRTSSVDYSFASLVEDEP